LPNLLLAFESAVNADAGGTLDWVNDTFSNRHLCLDAYLFAEARCSSRVGGMFPAERPLCSLRRCHQERETIPFDARGRQVNKFPLLPEYCLLIRP